MIPSSRCDNNLNVIILGHKILSLIKFDSLSFNDIFNILPKSFGVSDDHIILTLDWLYTINAIEVRNNKVYLNGTDNA